MADDTYQWIDTYQLMTKDQFNKFDSKPVLALGMFLYPDYKKKDLIRAYQVKKQVSYFHHAGYYIQALLPQPSDLGYRLLETVFELCNTNKDRDLDFLIEYESILLQVGLSCNRSCKNLENGYYPIDFDKDIVKRLFVDEMPDDLDDLINFENNTDRLGGIIGRWRCAILGAKNEKRNA